MARAADPSVLKSPSGSADSMASLHGGPPGPQLPRHFLVPAAVRTDWKSFAIEF